MIFPKGELAWGTIDTWLLWNLTGGTVHATDASNASRTMLMNLHTMQWDNDLLQKFRIPSRLLPSIWPTSHIYGATQDEFLEFPVKIGAVVGDQQAGLFGQTCFSPGMAKMTLGTSGVFDLHVGFQPLPIDGVVTNLGWTFGDAVEYTVEGVALMAGAVVQWLRDQLGLISNSGNPCEPWSLFLVTGIGVNYNKPENARWADGEGGFVVSELDEESNTAAQFNLGAGIEIRIGEDWRIRGEGTYHTMGNSKIDGRDTRDGSSDGFFGGSFFGRNSNDSWIHADLGLLYYFSKGEPSKYCQLYTGIAEVD